MGGKVAQNVTVNCENCTFTAVSQNGQVASISNVTSTGFTVNAVAAGNTAITVTGSANSGYSDPDPKVISIPVTVSPSGETPPPSNPPTPSGYSYQPTDYHGLKVGADIDLSETYYVNINEFDTTKPEDWREVTISKDTYYTPVANDGQAHKDSVVKTPVAGDGIHGKAASVSGWTPVTGEGMYYLLDADPANHNKQHNNFVIVTTENGTLEYRAYSNKLIASKSGNESDGMITGPGEGIGNWHTGTSSAYVMDNNGVMHQVLYANKGSTFHYNMFIYYVDSNGDVVFLTEGANESDGDSKYYDSYPSDPKSDTPNNGQGIGKKYYTYNNTLGNYGGKGYYTGTYFKQLPANSTGKVALVYQDPTNGKTYLDNAGAYTNGDHSRLQYSDKVVYQGPLYKLETLQRATYFSYAGGTPVESHLKDDVLTNFTLHTRTMSGDVQVDLDDGTDAAMGTLVDTTNNFKGNLFIQKRLYRANDGTYNIKLESWATGDMSTVGDSSPRDIILVLDQSDSMGMYPGTDPKRLQQLKDAVTEFVEEIPVATAPDGSAMYRLAMVGFSNTKDSTGSENYKGTGIFVGSNFTCYKDTSSYNSVLPNALVDVDNTTKVVDSNGDLTGGSFYQSKNALSAQARTYAKHGLEIAKDILDARTGTASNRKPIIIVFTDGQPGGTNAYNDREADIAIKRAEVLKSAPYNATIYSIGMFGSDTPDQLVRLTEEGSEISWGQGFNCDPPIYETDPESMTLEQKLKIVGLAFTGLGFGSWDEIKDYLVQTKAGWDSSQDQYTLYSTYTVDEYMSAISSEMDVTYNPTMTEDPSHPYDPLDYLAQYRAAYTAAGKTAPPQNNYYFEIQEGSTNTAAADLQTIFEDIAHSVATSDVPVDSTSILRDMINTSDFILPKIEAATATTPGTIKVTLDSAKEINSRKQIEWNGTEVENADLVAVNVHPKDQNDNALTDYLAGVEVHGFDYAAQGNFSAPRKDAASQPTLGKKVIVRIYGLMPKHGGDVFSNSEAGILDEGEMYLSVESPYDHISGLSYVVDYNAKMGFANGGYLVDANDLATDSVKVTEREVAGQNGAFTKNNASLFYQLQAKSITDENGEHVDYSFVGTDTALVFGQYYNNARADAAAKSPVSIPVEWRVNGEDVNDNVTASAWQTVTMIPASSVYYDDDFASAAKVVPVGDGSGYNSGLDVTAPTTAETKGKHQFVFTGTGIDIYCTTQDSSGTVKAKLDGENLVTMNNYAITTRYNVPTISYRDFGYGQHVVELTVLGSSNYKIDGVRIYGTNFDNQDIYDGTTEKNAVYLNLRDMLLEPADGSDKVEIPDTPAETSLQDIQFSQVLFVDDFNKYVMQKPVVGDDGKQLFDDEGNPRTTNVYDKEYDAYTAISPKNEIYLDGGQSIVLALTPDALTKNLWIGVSAPVDGEGSVSIGSGNTVSVNTLDQYYPIPADKITVSQNGVGTVTITNAGAEGSTISVTNLKLADKLPADGGTMNSLNLTQIESNELPQKVFAKMTMRSVKIAANDGVDPDAPAEVTDPEPTENPQQPSISEVVQQIISHFVEMLFRGIARMFGH